ncbi:tetratricopeptide repeat protein [Parvularcula marina]|uniref:Uncharacterized protein n=1 Tax=Parvularcula marina TaxID=2292771 RepID=A0A371RH61_9PROT|nr:tetratricopeptide repeat protein [Parvularcula marina]RFB04793.1 hypothetical protein DX908_05555 [Parvularcula marina]
MKDEILTETTPPSAAGRLVGWKRIAAHLGCGERTARRWGAEEDLPVHRQAHESRSTVFAYPAELDHWLASRTAAPGVEEAAPSSQQGLRFGWLRSRLVLALLAGLAAVIFAVVTLSREPAPSADGFTRDPEAADLYERGRALWQQRGEEPNRRAISLLSKAVEQDPEFAEGWAALASAWATLPTYSDDISNRRAEDEATLAANRALSLNPRLAEPRSLMVTFAQRHGDWAESERIYEEALAADPDNPTVLLWYAGHYRELGMFEQVDLLLAKARALDPNAPPIRLETAMNTLHNGGLDEGEAMLDEIWFDLGLHSPIVWTGKWLAFLKRDDRDALAAWTDEMPFNAPKPLFRRFAQMSEEASSADREALAADIVTASADNLPPWLAYIMLEHLGETNRALDIAERKAETGQFYNSVVLFDPFMTETRQTERFARITERLGFLPYWRENGAPTLCAAEKNAPFCRAIAGKDE